MTIINAATRRKIIRLYVDEQYSMDAIGQVVGCSKTNVYRILDQENIPRRVGGNSTRTQGLNGRSKADMSTIPEAGQIVARYQAGETIAAIAKDLHRHLATVRACITAAGLTIRHGSVGRPKPQTRTCHDCNERIPISDWTNHQYTAHGIETEGAAINRKTEEYIAEHQAAWKAAAQAKPRCPDCGYSPCITPGCCGRRQRAQAQHHYQKEDRRAA